MHEGHQSLPCVLLFFVFFFSVQGNQPRSFANKNLLFIPVVIFFHVGPENLSVPDFYRKKVSRSDAAAAISDGECQSSPDVLAAASAVAIVQL